MTEDEMVGWHPQLDGHEFEQVPGVGDAIQPFHPLSSPSPTFNLSQHQGVFSTESALCIRWPKYWSFSFSISPSNKYSGLISFRMYWLDLLSVQGTLKSLLQHHSCKASILPVLSLLYCRTSVTAPSPVPGSIAVRSVVLHDH